MSAETPPLTQATARKSLGQHFLFDPDILNRAAVAAGPVDGRTVIEVGPGPGGLTRSLLDAGAERVIAVEMDERFAGALREWPEIQTGRLVVVEQDAMTVDYAALLAEHGASLPAMVIANLPYNVGTPLLVNWLKAGDWRGEMGLMFQKEVVQRICAKPGDTHYGRLAVLTCAVCEPFMAFTLPPGAFKPPPKVASAFVVLRPLPDTKRYDDLEALERVTGATFGQRRKMLRASLKSIMPAGVRAETFLEDIGIPPTARAEVLNQDQFRRLATAWRALQVS